jgi:hypothetical protein
VQGHLNELVLKLEEALAPNAKGIDPAMLELVAALGDKLGELPDGFAHKMLSAPWLGEALRGENVSLLDGVQKLNDMVGLSLENAQLTSFSQAFSPEVMTQPVGLGMQSHAFWGVTQDSDPNKWLPFGDKDDGKDSFPWSPSGPKSWPWENKDKELAGIGSFADVAKALQGKDVLSWGARRRREQGQLRGAEPRGVDPEQPHLARAVHALEQPPRLPEQHVAGVRRLAHGVRAGGGVEPLVAVLEGDGARLQAVIADAARHRVA